MKVGILGGGQLAQMLAMAGKPLGMEFMFLCPNADACAAPYGQHLQANFDDLEKQQLMADWAKVITYEFENVPLATAKNLDQLNSVHPNIQALAIAADRCEEKALFQQRNVSTATFAPIASDEELTQAKELVPFPAILKTRREGYDGKGQVSVAAAADLHLAWESLERKACILESRVKFRRELSIIAARDHQGNFVFYPVTENIHREGILRLSLALANDPAQAAAEKLIQALMDETQYVGVMALELFDINGELYANEYAPRVHNSGHWTMDGADHSQFENHLRAVTGMPLAQPNLLGLSAMINIIGEEPEQSEVDKIAGATTHLYGKAAKPGRKLGHININAAASDKDVFKASVEQALSAVKELGKFELPDLS